MDRPIDQQNEIGFNMARRNVLYSTGCLFELTKWIIVAVIIGILIHFFIVTIAIVDGASMEPNFHTGEYLVINRFQYNFGSPQRGDAVVLKYPGDPEHKKYIKRIVGLPNERITIKNGYVYINSIRLNEPYINAQTQAATEIDMIIPKDEYFTIGDNRLNSSDSRIWGTAAKRFLIGKAWVEFYPEIKKIEQPQY